MLQRDVFISALHKKMKKNKNIYFLSADFGATALDDLRKEFKKNFIHCGISEQAMLDMATGLALEKKIVFVYAMAPFLSLRALEQIKCGPGLMNLPISILSVGIGLGYADSGPTHYANEDFASVRTVLGNSIYTISSPQQCLHLVGKVIQKPEFNYIRFDRHNLPDIKSNIKKKEILDGFIKFGSASKNKVLLISHGKTSHIALEVYKRNPNQFYLIDLIQSKPFPKKMSRLLENNKGIIVIDEQNVNGGLASCVFEACSNLDITKTIRTVCLPDKYIYENGGREYLLNKYGISYKGIIKKYNQFF